jgi:hypothetical protein
MNSPSINRQPEGAPIDRNDYRQSIDADATKRVNEVDAGDLKALLSGDHSWHLHSFHEQSPDEPLAELMNVVQLMLSPFLATKTASNPGSNCKPPLLSRLASEIQGHGNDFQLPPEAEMATTMKITEGLFRGSQIRLISQPSQLVIEIYPNSQETRRILSSSLAELEYELRKTARGRRLRLVVTGASSTGGSASEQD